MIRDIIAVTILTIAAGIVINAAAPYGLARVEQYECERFCDPGELTDYCVHLCATGGYDHEI